MQWYHRILGSPKFPMLMPIAYFNALVQIIFLFFNGHQISFKISRLRSVVLPEKRQVVLEPKCYKALDLNETKSGGPFLIRILF